MVTFNSVEKSDQDIADMITERISKGHGFFVAVENDCLLGFATYAQFRGGAGYARTMEHTIILSDSARGRGVGKQLMHRLLAHAKKGGAISMFAGVSAANPAGVAFHAALGFSQVATLEKVGCKFDAAIDLVLMQKFL